MHEMTNPLNPSFSIRLFGNIINTVADNLFNDMLIHTGFLCRGDELNTTIMRTMRGARPEAFTTNALPFLCVFWLATQRYHRTIHSLWMWRNQTIKRFFIKRINKEYLRMLILNQSAAAIENDYTCRFQSTYTNCIRFLFAERGWMCYNQNSFLRCIFRR